MVDLVRHIDHVLVRADDVAGLWTFFTKELGLPVAWPPFEYQGFLSAAFSAGNTNVELLEPRSPGVPAGTVEPGGRPIGVAFEPFGIEDAVALLDERRIPHADPWAYQLAPGLSWESIPLGPLPGCPIALFVKYSRDQDGQRAALTGQLAGHHGGTLGVTGFASISFQTNELAPWTALLGEAGPRWEVDRSYLELTDGTPAVELRVRSLEFAVSDWRTARPRETPRAGWRCGSAAVPRGSSSRRNELRGWRKTPGAAR